MIDVISFSETTGTPCSASTAFAVAAADAIGYPSVMKVESPDILHKTEAGVIRIGVKTAAEVRDVYGTIMANACKVASRERINGVRMQPLVPAGVELMVGGRVDPQFGPLLVIGLGGVFVELMKDTAAALAPVTPGEARRLLERLRGNAIFAGFRGAPAVFLDALPKVVARISHFASDHADAYTEFDVNPLICAEGRVIAVDALIALRPQEW